MIEELRKRGLLPIVEKAAAEHHVTVAGVLSRSRFKSCVEARRAACVALRALGLSYPEIGALVGRDHTSIMGLVKARRRDRELLASDANSETAA